MKWLFSILVGLVLLASVVWVVYSDSRTRALSVSQRALEARAQAVSQALDHTLELRMVEVFTLSALPSIRGFAASDETARPARTAVALSELQSIVAADPNVRAASITDENGTVILTTDNTMKAEKGQRVFVREALAGHLHASVPAREFGEISQYFSAPILNNARTVAGVLFIRVAVQEMWDLLNAQGNVLVVDSDGVRVADHSASPQPFVALAPLPAQTTAQILGESRYGVETTQIRATNLTELANAAKSAKPTSVTYHDDKGQVSYGAIRPMEMNPWKVIAFESEDNMLAAAAGTLWDEVRVAAAAVVITLGVVFAVQWVDSAGQEQSS
jgi:hypothetical protein